MRALGTTLLGAVLLIVAVSIAAAGELPPKRVLILHSFGPDFGDLYSKDLRVELDRELPGRLDLYEEWLVSARFSAPQEDTAFEEYLSKLFADHPLDLIISLGAPAAEFIRKHRQTLFPQTPELLADVEQRRVDSTSPQSDEAAVPISVSFPVVAENILRVLPRTKTLAVVIGNSAIEKYWVGQIRESLQPFTDRLTLTFLNDLSFEELLKRVSSLPSDSAIFYVLLSRTVSGIPEDEDVALARLHAAADAPMFSYSDAYLGKGIVGGPMISAEDQVKKIAGIAVRILGGERASGIETPPLQFGKPLYDGRELKHWRIQDTVLPPESSIRFVEKSAWEQYRWQIAAGGVFMLLQTFLIFGLLYERRRRLNAENISRQQIAELARMNRLSTAESSPRRSHMICVSRSAPSSSTAKQRSSSSSPILPTSLN